MKKIIQAIEAYQMLAAGDLVVVGLSGGADSVALTYALQRFGANVIAVHINHMLRGEESERDEVFVRKFCEEQNIPCAVYRVDISEKAKESKVSVETAGREWRYRIFFEEARKYGAKVATAHTLSDQTETMLFRLARGSGMRGLCGIAPISTQQGITVIRPLIGMSRAEIEDFCRRYGISYVTDSTNEEDDYVRNRIRHHIVTVLKEINPQTETHFGVTAKQLSLDESYLSQTAAKAYGNCKEGRGLSAEKLLLLHPAMRSRVVTLFLDELGINADAVMLDRIFNLLQRQTYQQGDKRYGEVSLPGKRELLLRGGILFLSQSESDAVFPSELGRVLESGAEGRFEMPSGQVWIFSRIDTKPIQKVHKNLFFFCLDYDKIIGVLTCRGRLPGDRITISGRGISKTVKKWMNEAGVPVDEREKRFVLADDEGVLMVEGLGIAGRAAVTDSTRHFLIVKTPDGVK